MENTKEVKQMNEERMKAALELLRFKAIKELGKEKKLTAWVLDAEGVNEVLLVAGLPVIVPGNDGFELKIIGGEQK